jgi:hypothetical protein
MTPQASAGDDADRPQLSKTAVAALVREVEFDPVFIVGDHRSGTTVMYQALVGTGAFNAVTAYHVICNSDFLSDYLAGREDEARAALARRFAGLGLTNRGIDGVMVTPDLPEEYGFVIGRSSRPRLQPSTLPALVDLCQRIQFTRARQPLLLKNPWDVLCFAYVKQVFPRAKLVFVHRHPLHVMNSQLAAMRSLMANRNEYVALLSPSYRDIFEHPFRLGVARLMQNTRLGPRIVGRHMTKVARYYEQHSGVLPAHDVVEVRYEDFCAAPGRTIGRVLDFLELPKPSSAHSSDIVKPRRTVVLPEILQQYRRMRTAMTPYCARLGYDLEPSVSG